MWFIKPLDPSRQRSLLMLQIPFLLMQMTLPSLAVAGDDLPLWLVNTKLSGDFRYRHEGIDNENSSSIYRNRIRYRLGVETIVNEKVTVGARFASGSGDPRSTNQDLGDGLSSKPISLDRAYFELTPCEHWWVTAGKIANPFVSTDLQWDTDVNFEGGISRWATGSKNVVSLTGGAVWLEPYRSSQASGLWIGQLSVSGKHGSMGSWEAAAGMYSFVVEDALPNVFFGNTIEHTTLSYLRDFEILDVVAQVIVPAGKSKLTVTANPVMNTATSEENIGWLAMLTWKGQFRARTYSVSYDYRVLEADAVLGAFTDSDAAGGRTNQRGHRIVADWELIDGFTAGGSAYFNTLSASGDGPWYQRWMVDGVVKF